MGHHFFRIDGWEVEYGRCYLTSAAFSPDCKTVATGGDSVKLWEVATGKQMASLKRHADSYLSILAFSPNGKTPAGADAFEKKNDLWDVATGKSRASFQAHDEYLNCLAFSPDGKTLASGSEGKTIKLWDVPKLPPATP